MKDNDSVVSWPASWGRAFLTFGALSVVQRDGPVHGYGIMAELKAVLKTKTTGGVLYPLLHSLEGQGFLVSQWEPGDGGPGKKMHLITGQGCEELEQLQRGWSLFRANIDGLKG